MLTVLGLISSTTHAAPIPLEPPEAGAYVLDNARLIHDKNENRIRAICDDLLARQDMLIVVVTIDSMESLGRPHYSIEDFARLLFYQWGQRGSGFRYRVSWSRGILLLVSYEDRKARIELGADWAGQYDEQCQRVMDRLIIPAFKEGHFSRGIFQGVVGLEAMSRGEELPKWTLEDVMANILIVAFLAGCLIFLHVITKLKPRRNYSMYYREHRSYSSYSSDSSGGGGATGSW